MNSVPGQPKGFEHGDVSPSPRVHDRKEVSHMWVMHCRNWQNVVQECVLMGRFRMKKVDPTRPPFLLIQCVTFRCEFTGMGSTSMSHWNHKQNFLTSGLFAFLPLAVAAGCWLYFVSCNERSLFICVKIKIKNKKIINRSGNARLPAWLVNTPPTSREQNSLSEANGGVGGVNVTWNFTPAVTTLSDVIFLYLLLSYRILQQLMEAFAEES